MIVVDTTVLVYAVGDTHPLREPCRELVTLVASGDLAAVTTPEVIQEFCHVRARRRTRNDAVALARHYATLFAPLAVVEPSDLDAGLSLFTKHDDLGAFDAVLCTVAQRLGAVGLVSGDRAFDRVRGLRHLDPATPSFHDELMSLS